MNEQQPVTPIDEPQTEAAPVAEAQEAQADKPAIVHSKVAKETLVGDLRDCVLNVFKNTKLSGKAWKDMTESEQTDLVFKVTKAVEYGVIRAIDIIRSEGQQHVKAILKQVTVKDGYKGVFEFPDHEALRHDIVDAQGETILIVLTKAEEFLGEGEAVKIDKDQPELIEENADPETGETEEDDDIDEDGDDFDDTPSVEQEGTLDAESKQYT